jgi:acetyltransferase-like isoleucine patch superfamily enzyme
MRLSALGSMVNGKIEANCIAVGTPAKVVKSGFTWAGERLTEGDPYPS